MQRELAVTAADAIHELGYIIKHPQSDPQHEVILSLESLSPRIFQLTKKQHQQRLNRMTKDFVEAESLIKKTSYVSSISFP